MKLHAVPPRRLPKFFYAVHSYHFDLHMKIAEYAGCGARRESLPPTFHRELIGTLAGADVAADDERIRRIELEAPTECRERRRHDLAG